jgi:gamma-glutamyl phosphate reductase
VIDASIEKIKVKEKSVNMIQEEKRDCLDRLRKVQKELDLIS